MSKQARLERSAGHVVRESMGAKPRGSALSVVSAEAAPAISAEERAFFETDAADDVREIAVESITPDPTQPRKSFRRDKIAQMAASLKARGQLQPIRVRWSESAGKWLIVCGERRWRASKEAGITHLKCVIASGEATAARVLADQLIENLLRDDLTVLEVAESFARLRDEYGWSVRQFADEMGVEKGFAERALATWDLPAEVKEHIDRGNLPQTTALEIGRLDDESRMIELAGEAAAYQWTRAKAVEEVRAILAPDKVAVPIADVPGVIGEINTPLSRSETAPGLSQGIPRGSKPTPTKTAGPSRQGVIEVDYDPQAPLTRGFLAADACEAEATQDEAAGLPWKGEKEHLATSANSDGSFADMMFLAIPGEDIHGFVGRLDKLLAKARNQVLAMRRFQPGAYVEVLPPSPLAGAKATVVHCDGASVACDIPGARPQRQKLNPDGLYLMAEPSSRPEGSTSPKRKRP